MRRVLLLLISMFSIVAFSQTESKDSSVEYERIYIEAGFLQPIGKLSNKFDLSPSFGFWYRTKMNREDFIDFGFNFFIPKKPLNVNFKYRDSVVQYKSSHFAINIGTRFAKVISLSQRKTDFNLEWNSGIGLALNFYNAQKELEFESGEHTKEVLTTFYLSQGIKLNYRNTGLQCHYQWSPYGLFNDQVETNFGSQSLMFGIVYRQ
ncbi:hypothetical protein [Flavobacterium collinsii]|uniref:Outer membrane protein beta-barrel domain-containing protein n=1 Tax=Flavobacterium collinsii TaxID=1114861 RepID=A0A9W4X5U5_9FLAO|nr:hypothetical protein [Flavobacterium collinsii]CAI2766424.1 conserved exported protein of unknown function [Flavobacterium collinsii]